MTTPHYACNTSTGSCYESSAGSYTSLTTCNANCDAAVNYACDTTTGSCYESSAGSYTSLTTCNSNCDIAPRYSCNSSTGSCYEDSSGAFSNLTTCNSNCTVAPVTHYSCNTTTGTCGIDAGGSYTDLTDCSSNCSIGSYAVSGYVYIDTNKNGIRDPEETIGVQGVTVSYYTLGGDTYTTQTTDNTGKYSFNVPEGTWYIDIVTPTNYERTGTSSERVVSVSGDSSIIIVQ